MASGTYPAAAGMTGLTEANTFVPELWSDEVIATYKQALKLALLVKRMTMKGKKGDTLHIPSPTRGVASAKAENTAVTIQANVESEVVVTIDRHFEYSKFIEDIVEVQALASMRRFYTEDAGYALARRVDTDLWNLGTGLGNGTVAVAPDGTGADWVNSAVFYNDSADGLSPYAVDTVVSADVFTDLAFRELIQLLDDDDVPMEDRYFVVPPALRKTMMGIERFVSSDFRDDRTVKSGKIGSIYGIDIYVSSNAPVIETAAANTASSVDTRAAMLFHKDAFVLAEQMAVRSQAQYKQEYLSTLYTADTLYGRQVLRPEAGKVIAVPNS